MTNLNKEAAADVAATNATLSATGGVSPMPKQTIWSSRVPLQDRTIRFGIAAETLTAIAEITGNQALHHAIGYLTQWNLAHPFCEIIGGVYDGTPELVATYRKEERGPITYQIGAVWHEGKAIDGMTGDTVAGHFGFHS
jgi:hypothetical protein